VDDPGVAGQVFFGKLDMKASHHVGAS
jgi:hypothetical protein